MYVFIQSFVSNICAFLADIVTIVFLFGILFVSFYFRSATQMKQLPRREAERGAFFLFLPEVCFQDRLCPGHMPDDVVVLQPVRVEVVVDD